MPARLYKMISKRLEETREARGYSRAELGALVGVSAATIGYYERGERCPDLEKFTAICRVLDISSDYLLEITDTKQQQTPPPGLDPDRTKQASHLASIIYKIAERDQNAGYDRDCLPIYSEILGALATLSLNADIFFSEIQAKYPVFAGMTPASIPYELRIKHIADNMYGQPPKASTDWIKAKTEFTEKLANIATYTGNLINILIVNELLGRLLGDSGQHVISNPNEHNVPPVVPTK